MKTLQDLIEKYTYDEKVPTIDDLFLLIQENNLDEEKEILIDTFDSEFCQSHYDYMCGKFNNLEWILDLLQTVENIKILSPDFEQYFYYKAHVFEMLSSVSEDKKEKLKYNQLCLDYLNQYLDENPESVTTLNDIADNIFVQCQLKNDFSRENLDKIKQLLLEAICLERKEENQGGFFAFNGMAIHSFLDRQYSFLGLKFENYQTYFKEYQVEFKKVMIQFSEDNPSIYFHWAETLLRITEWINYPSEETCRITEEDVTLIWREVKEISKYITNLKSKDEHFLTAIGHLFHKIAKHELDFDFFALALNYYQKAIIVNPKTWTNPYYASEVLKNIAFIHLKNKETEKAQDLFLQGKTIYKKAQNEINDFQLSIHHANFLMEYAKYFENYSNTETLLECKKLYEESKILGKDFYTSPFYGLAKTNLLLGNKSICLEVLKQCCEIFSNEYHTHTFDEILKDEDFVKTKGEIIKIQESFKIKIKK
ncbi:hypothetical protein [Aureivirga sp. CE67]|uniref:hypothetical protein n=1 Tax=Aureivirga sp. CE67 TaxID=1788983 RepID=UPI0018CB3F62|nr:hypothetical protein [Aureivirga sp. CE67]